jgi:hypothetical protein
MASGTSVRPVLSAMASVLTTVALGAADMAWTAAARCPVLTCLLCHGIAGSACTLRVYRCRVYSAGLTILAIFVTLTAMTAL